MINIFDHLDCRAYLYEFRHYSKKKFPFLFILAPLIISGFFIPISANTTNYLKAREFLQTRGEVYFSFDAGNKSKINELKDIISIARIEGTRVFAYGSRETFTKFTRSDLNYETLTPPSMVGPAPKMSDYKNPDLEKWDKYPTYQGYLNIMENFQKKYPDKVKLYHPGNSATGKKIIVAEVSANVLKRENEPKFFHTAAIHGDEVTGYVFLLHMMDYLLKEYGNDRSITKLIDSASIFFAPLLNPDGTYAESESSVRGATRGNSRYVDLNRDYQYPGGGKNPQPETRAIIDFQTQHRFVMSIDFHDGMECFLYPWAYKRGHPNDEQWFGAVCREYVDAVHKVNPNTFNDNSGSAAKTYYIAKGIRSDHQLYKDQCRGVTIELSSIPVINESELLKYWNFHRDAVLNFYMEMFNGIRGNVKTLKDNGLVGVPVKVTVTSNDGRFRDDEYSHVFADTLHGNFYRPIHPGTYNVTFSHPDYADEVRKNVVVKRGEGTHIDVIMAPKTKIYNYLEKLRNNISFRRYQKGIKISILKEFNTRFKQLAIYNVQGISVRTFHREHLKRYSTIQWNGLTDYGTTTGNGYYILKITSINLEEYTQPFMFVR